MSDQRRALSPEAVVFGLALALLVGGCLRETARAVRDLWRPAPETYPARNVCVSADPHGCRDQGDWPTAWAEAEFAHSWRDADAGCMSLALPARELGYDAHHTVVVQPRLWLTSEGCWR